MDLSVAPVLYVVATPIGNLDDITYRAVEVLKSVDVIAAEDTRNTSVLLDKYKITTKLISYHKFSENSRVELFLDYLSKGLSIALVSDAGTPLISDPGNILVHEVRKNGYKIVPVAGASAVTTFLSSIEREGEDFKFIGFLPRIKNKIEETIVKNKKENLIFYESPKRLLETLEIIYKLYPEKKVSIGRELTKKFEQIQTDNIKNIIDFYKTNILKGEIVVMLHKDNVQDCEIDIDEKIKKLKKLNLKDKEISSVLSILYNVNKNTIYKRCLELN